MRLHAPGFVYVRSPTEVVTRKQWRDEWKVNLAETKSVESASWEIKELAVKASRATTLVQIREAYIAVDTRGQVGPKGQSHHWVAHGRLRDTWIRTSQGWKLRKSEELGGKMIIDGKPSPRPKT